MDASETVVDIRVLSEPNQLKVLRQRVKEVVASTGFSSKEQQELVLAVDEACSNIIRHAYHFESDREIHLIILKTDEALIFQLSDDANQVDTSKFKPREWDQIRPGGLGLHFIQEVMDKVAFIEAETMGNTLEMVKYF